MLYEAFEQNVGLDGLDGVGDTPWTVTTTRAPAVLKKTWMALLVADRVALLFVRGGALFLLLQRWDCQTI